MIYFDSSYLVRLYYQDPGFEAVRQLAGTRSLVCAQHGRAEVISALQRKRREGSLSDRFYLIALQQFRKEIQAGAFTWLPLSPAVFARIDQVYATLEGTVFLRAADAMHLACAAESGFADIYSNDQHLLVAASYFGLKGVNIIGGGERPGAEGRGLSRSL